MKRKTKKVLRIAVCVAVGVAIVVSGGVLYFTRNKESSPLNITLNKKTYEKEEIPDHGYRSETTYDGTGEFDEAVYDIPFNGKLGSTETEEQIGSYTNNIEWIKKYSKKDAETNVAIAKLFWKRFLVKPREIEKDRDSYLKNILELMYIDNESQTTLFFHDDDFRIFADWLVKNNVQVDAEFKSDSSLVWTDGYTYVRGELDIASYNCDTEQELFRHLPLHRDGKYIVDISIGFDSVQKKVNIFDVQVVGEIVDGDLVVFEDALTIYSDKH